jgi:tRNA dimethylallyltransferase
MNDSFTSMQGIGYKEVLYYLDNKYSYDQMITAIKTNSRRYAKRQLTWFKRYEELKWFDFDDYDSFEQYLAKIKEFILSNL